MVNRDYSYFLLPIAKQDEAATRGFPSGNVSDDGNWVVVNKHSNEMASDWIDLDISTIPQWMKDIGVTHCCFNRDLAEQIVSHPSYHEPKDVIDG